MDIGTMDVYYKIYDRLYENPFISDQELAASTGIPESEISQYVKAMYESSILFGPLIFLKPAQNRRRYTYFLLFDNPLEMGRKISTMPHVVNTTVSGGAWNLLVVTEVEMDFSVLEGFKRCTHNGVKGRTHLSKVTIRDWDTSMKGGALHHSEKKSFLYKEVPCILWGEKEWTLFQKFKFNVRVNVESVLESCNISHQSYQQWISQLPQVAVLQSAFYPHSPNAYSVFQFLFTSQYHHQLSSILGMLPRTSIFFSTGDDLYAHLFIKTRKEVKDIFSFIFKLKDIYFTDLCYATFIGVYSRKQRK